jgi:hypothetical protein
VHGEVFIVTKGAQNIKLGLVQVAAIPEDRIHQFIETKLSKIAVEFSKYKSLENGTSTQVQNAQQALDATQAQYDLVNGQLQTARTAADQAEEVAYSLLADPAYSSPQEVQTYQTARNKADTLKRRVDQLDEQLETLRYDLDAKQKDVSAAKSSTTGQLRKVLELLSDEELFKDVPSDGVKAVTNSDGQFSMKLRANQKYVIAAKAQRRVFDSTEQYYWLIWVSPDGEQVKRVMLTNNNLMGTDSPDSVFKTKELIPSGIYRTLRTLRRKQSSHRNRDQR